MKKRLIAIVLLLGLAMQLFGCSEKVVYEYAQEHSKVNDPCGSGWLVNENLAVVTLDHNIYRFDNDISEEIRSQFIHKQQALCGLLGENGITVENCEFFVLTEIDARALHEKRAAYMDVSQLGTYEQICLTLQAVMGEYTNYGYLYALSNEIARRLNWTADAYGTTNQDCLTSRGELLNLAYPCFSGKYYNEVEIKACKALSEEILSKMDNPFVGERAFMDLVQEYAEDKKIDFEPTYLTFTYGGGNCPLKIRTKFLEIYLDSDYEGSFTLTNKTVREDPMFNFDTMIEFWEAADRDIEHVRTVFKMKNDYIMPVYVQSIYIKMNEGGEYGGYYAYGEDGGEITLAQITAITHEYTHYADYCTDINMDDDLSWCSEVLACYYGKNMEFAARMIMANSGSNEFWTIADYSRVIGHHYDSVEDEILFQNIYTAYLDNYHYAVISSYDGRLSFGAYFVETYGEDAFVQCMQNPNFATILIERTVDDVVDDWCLWLEQFRILD